MLLMIDNYDSFTYNLVQYFGELGEEVGSSATTRSPWRRSSGLRPARIVISPGPCSPEEAGISVAAIRHFAGKIPLLGVCLGHQAIGAAFGGKVVRSASLMHGKTSPIHHDGKGLFTGLPNPFEATRYHSLVVERASLPGCLEITAWVAEGEIMGLAHRELPVWGVQFHPESILTVGGMDILRNFLEMTEVSRRSRQVVVPKEPVMIKKAIAKVVEREDLTEAEMIEVMDQIMSGEATPAQIAAFITALRMKGETVEEITGAARVMRDRVTPIRVGRNVLDIDRDDINIDQETILDVVGTGGSGTNTFNISTTVAFVVSACGVKVAKHGNRSVSSTCGSADVLEALGVNLDVTPETVEKCINEIGIGFLFAPALHGAMKHAIGPRQEIGIRTIFNILGPLTNPAGAGLPGAGRLPRGPGREAGPCPAEARLPARLRGARHGRHGRDHPDQLRHAWRK